jgi:hypothetical protein
MKSLIKGYGRDKRLGYRAVADGKLWDGKAWCGWWRAPVGNQSVAYRTVPLEASQTTRAR